ncbi:MAG: BBP7 family outer membrane beta-barrel protein, partial [Planctomycetota bacterium]
MFTPRHVAIPIALVFLLPIARAQESAIGIAPKVEFREFSLVETIDSGVRAESSAKAKVSPLLMPFDADSETDLVKSSPPETDGRLRDALSDVLGGINDRLRASRRRHDWEADLLYWWISSESAPNLLVSNPAGTSLAQAGLPSATSSTLVGGNSFGDQGALGFRLAGRYRTRHTVFNRIDWSWIYLFDQHDKFRAESSSGSPILGRPFFNTSSNQLDSQIIAYPGLTDGSFDADYFQSFAGGDVLGSICLHSDACNWLELV